MTEKEAASKHMADYQQTRKGRRPIRVATLLKKGQAIKAIQAVGSSGRAGAAVAKGSVAKGGEKAFNNLPKARPRASSAEVGPVPGMKKASVEFDMMENDPLIQYLKKHAAADKPPTSGLVDSEGILDDNIEKMPTGKPSHEATSMCPCPTPTMEKEVKQSWQPYLEQMFEDREGITRKYEDKDHSPTELGEGSGNVKRVLGLK